MAGSRSRTSRTRSGWWPRLWVVTTAGPTLVEIDPDPDEPAELDRLALSDAPPLFDRANVDLTGTGDDLWVSSVSEDRVYRVRPS